MESFGAYLKGLREERGVSLEEISAHTKIAVSNLDLLERDRYDLLPPQVFVKGFIRSYVQELGHSPEEVLKRFDDFSKDGEMPDYSQEEHPIFGKKPVQWSFMKASWFTWILTAAGLICLIILILTGVTRLLLPAGTGKSSQPAVRTVQPADYGPASSTQKGQSQRSPAGLGQPARKYAGSKVLEIRAHANAWVRVEPDRGPAEELFMAPGDVQVFTAEEGFVLHTGNAGGLRVRYDGRELPPLGKSNQTLSLSLP
jgi:cytoskeleton protein RodZ